MARQIAPVRMVGTFGSEIICAAVVFKASMPSRGIYCEEVLSQVSQAAETFRNHMRGNRRLVLPPSGSQPLPFRDTDAGTDATHSAFAVSGQ